MAHKVPFFSRPPVAPAVLALALVACVALSGWPRAEQARAMPGSSRGGDRRPALPTPAQATEELLALHNRYRTEARLKSVEISKKLQAAAEAHAKDMAARHKMSHEGEDGSVPATRIARQGYRFRRCGENVAFGPRTCEAVMEGWMKSPTHKANVLGSFTQIGAAYATAADGTPFWCVTFGLPARRN